MMKKSFCIVAAVAVAGALAYSSTAVAKPISTNNPYKTPEMIDQISPFNGGTGINAGPGPNHCESTGYEFVEANCTWELGWICGSTFTACVSPPIAASCTGNPIADVDCCIDFPNPANSWWLSGSNQQCNEPHISQLNPASGENHLRFQRDPAGGNPPGCTAPDFNTSCRVNAFSPVADPYPLGPVTVEFDVAMGLPSFNTPPFGSAIQYNTVSQDSLLAVAMYFHAAGILFVYDYGIQGFYYVSYVQGDGFYDNIRTEFNPCTGIVEYYVNDVLLYTGSTVGGTAEIVRAFWSDQNIGGNWDFDNYSVTRHEPCPTTCGDGNIEVLEECEVGDDACCPGNCDLETCLCIKDNAFPAQCPLGGPSMGRAINNGVNGPYLTDGGLYEYTADAEFTMFDTCGSDYDTEIIGLAPDCNTITFYNDECSGDYGGNPAAPCYAPTCCPLRSCACVDTDPGTTYLMLVDAWQFTLAPPFCSSTVVNVTKMADCDTAVVLPGSCCDHLTGVCTDDVMAADCMGEFQTYNDNKSCELAGPCDAILGACCNTAPGAGGACTDTLMADCQADWTPGVLCSELDPPCEETRGACCNALTGFCSVVLQSACVGDDLSWSEGLDCSEITCNAALGACCRASEMTAECVQSTQAECPDDPPFLTWYRDTDCAEITCEPLFTPIPTVSEWGLVIMALLLLVGGKVYFGRRQTAIA